MIAMSGDRIAEAMAAEVVAVGPEGMPGRAEIDTRKIHGGELFFGLPGENVDGGSFGRQALEAGAWGVVVRPEQADSLRSGEGPAPAGWIFAVDDPLLAMQRLASEWRQELGAKVVGITGSVGKTSVKDMTRDLLPGVVHASEQNMNTEIGVPLTILSAEPGTEFLVLEMAMRGRGQIAELAEIGRPDVAVITTVGPVHIELLGSVAAIAEAKAEIIGGLGTEGVLVAPVEAGELEPHLGKAPRLVRFGEGGDVSARDVAVDPETGTTRARIETPLGSSDFEFPFPERHNLVNATTAVAVGITLGVDPEEMSARAGRIRLSRLRGERLVLDDGTLLLNDCYNANPVSMRAALDALAAEPAATRIAVLGLMGELGEGSAEFHSEVGEYARSLGIDTVIGVGPESRGYAPDVLVDDPVAATAEVLRSAGPGTVVLIKGSRSAGLEAVGERLVGGGS
jgi:UDP-N-acetylmuramoyl-tripeptide--D-alanyl-D-alanine ligase